jgi:hypothetical protein
MRLACLARTASGGFVSQAQVRQVTSDRSLPSRLTQFFALHRASSGQNHRRTKRSPASHTVSSEPRFRPCTLPRGWASYSPYDSPRAHRKRRCSRYVGRETWCYFHPQEVLVCASHSHSSLQGLQIHEAQAVHLNSGWHHVRVGDRTARPRIRD